MELIPIIYTALIIFLIITVVTIISSYISYKVRRKTSHEDEKDKEKFTSLHQNATVPRLKIKPKKESKPHPKQERPKSKRHEKPVIKNEAPKQKELPKETSKQPERLTEKTERINILNKKNGSNEPVKKPVVKDNRNTNLHSLGDNILDNYADDNDDDFHSLNATKEE